MRVWRSRGDMRTRLGSAGVFACALAACSSSDQRPPSAGGATTDFDPSVGAEDDSAAASDGGVRDGGRDSAVSDDATLPDLPDVPPQVDPESERLVVSDATDAKLYVVDARDFSVVAELDASAGSHIVSGPSGRYAYVYSGTGNAVHVVDVGLSVVRETGMPARPALSAPSVLSTTVDGAGPRSVLVDGSGLAVSFGLEPRASFFDESGLPGALDVRVTNTGLVHDGVALTVGSIHIASRRDDEANPHWALVSADMGTTISLPECSDPYLAASAGNNGAVVCSEGIAVLLQEKSGAFSSAFYSYTFAGTASGHDLVSRPASAEFAFIDGTSTVVHVDANGAMHTDMSAEVAAIAYPPRGKQLWVLLKNGQLALLDAATLVMDGEPTDTGCATATDGPLPALRFGAASAYLTCPAHGDVRELDAGSGVLGTAHTLGKAPFDLASFTF